VHLWFSDCLFFVVYKTLICNSCFGIGKLKHDAVYIQKLGKDQKERKISPQAYRFMSYWTEKFQNNLYLRKLFMKLIQEVCVCYKKISSDESLNLVSEVMFLQNVSILEAASNQCEFTSSRKICVHHLPFKFEGISFNSGFSGQESLCITLYQKRDLGSKTVKINNFERFIIRNDFNLIVSIISKETSFQYLMPPFIKYLESDHAYDFPLKCLHLISLIFSCSYNPFSDKDYLLVTVKYICCCMLEATISNWDGCYTCQKVGTIMNKIRNKILPVQEAIVEDLKEILSDPFTNYQACLGILVAMKSMEFVTVGELLFASFKDMAVFADKKVRQDFYFLLLDVCEIFTTKLIKSEIEPISLKDLFVASECLNFFKEDLSLRLTPAFNTYKARMFKEMKYDFKKYHKITMGEGLEDPNTFFQNFMKNHPKVRDEEVPDYPRSTDYFKCDYSFDCFDPDEKLGGREKSGGDKEESSDDENFRYFENLSDEEEERPDYPRSTDYFKCDYSFDCFDPDEKLGGREKSGGDKEESSDDENFRYFENLSDEEEERPCDPESSLLRKKRKYVRFLGELPKNCLDHKNLIPFCRKKGKNEKPGTGDLSIFL
ncbi:hypothetical protein TNIN_319271, partial [Trichonephila inaurata madagascariensis]